VAIVAVGMHEWDAPLEVFERVAVAGADLGKALAELTASPHLSEVVVLSTCLRTEIYAVVERFHDGLADIEAYFASRLGRGDSVTVGRPSSGNSPEPGGGVIDLGGGLRCRYDDAAISHLFEVAAGIDSPVLGEGEILRQVRHAAAHARAEHTAGPVLGPLFRHAVEAGKRARTLTSIQRGTTSLAHAAVGLAAQELDGLWGRRVLLIGAGTMGTGLARALAGRPDLTGEMVVVNRGSARAAAVAELTGGRAAGLEQLHQELALADVVLTSTAADDVLLGPDVVTAARRGSPFESRLVVVDVAVPRDVDPSVADCDNVVLFDIEHVRNYAEEQMQGRQAEVPAVRALLAEDLERYRMTTAGRLAAPVISALREKAERVRAAEVERYGPRLDALGPVERDLLEKVTRRVVAKLLHEPTVRLKEAAGSPKGERMTEALRALFDL
jgi:glutamyl-tRNA reductase